MAAASDRTFAPEPSEPAVIERTECPACGATAARALLRQGFGSEPLRKLFENHYEGRARVAALLGHQYWLVRCGRCELAYQKSIPSPALVEEIYEQWIPASERERLLEQYSLDDYGYWADQVQFAIRHSGKRPYDVRVFDFGMGWGEWASMAKAYGCQSAGAELSQARVEHARSVGIEVLSWDEIPKRRFDFINTEQVFEHLVDPWPVLQHLVKALDTNGVLKISVPDCRNALRAAERSADFGELAADAIMPIHPLEHINCFEHATLVRFAQRAGLTLLRPSFLAIYDSSSGWLSPRRALKQLARPFYRHVYPKSTYAFFVKSAPSPSTGEGWGEGERAKAR